MTTPTLARSSEGKRGVVPTSDYRTKRNEFIRDKLLEDSALSYAEVAEMVREKFGELLARGVIADIAQRECRKVNPRWRKKNPLPKTYRCQKIRDNGKKCNRKFKGERGYSGIHAVYCPEHRSRRN